MLNMEPSFGGTRQYSHPEVLMDTTWVAQHLSDSTVRLMEADEDVLLSETGHLPYVLKLAWHSDVLRSLDGAHHERMGTLTTTGGIEP